MNTDWAALLHSGGIEESPGRSEAVRSAIALSAQKRAARGLPQRSSNGSGRAHYTGIKHSNPDP